MSARGSVGVSARVSVGVSVSGSPSNLPFLHHLVNFVRWICASRSFRIWLGARSLCDAHACTRPLTHALLDFAAALPGLVHADRVAHLWR